ncbi:hypothetical protein G6F35_013063 [Rhizopus arrhizus]|nr:hypothetical protein G6F35_013063 [Rhizopus arrhizus]
MVPFVNHPRDLVLLKRLKSIVAFAAHAAERQYLVEEATKSYFHDINEMKEHGGKMYYANTQLMKPEMTGYMPDFEVQDLSKNKIHTTDKLLDKISLVTISLTQFGFEHTKSFSNPFWEKFGQTTKEIQLLDIIVEENLLKQILLKAFVTRALKNLPQERQEGCLLLYQDISRTKIVRYAGQHTVKRRVKRLATCWP